MQLSGPFHNLFGKETDKINRPWRESRNPSSCPAHTLVTTTTELLKLRYIEVTIQRTALLSEGAVNSTVIEERVDFRSENWPIDKVSS
jgi:hypothetical protein